jgi:hypothetical protein
MSSGISPFLAAQRARVQAWKARTATLPAEAKRPGGFIDQRGVAGPILYEFCVPPEYASYSCCQRSAT